jgi:hypothetical protein
MTFRSRRIYQAASGDDKEGSGSSEFDLVAQLVEHYTFNVRVLGSNPSGITQKLSR